MVQRNIHLDQAKDALAEKTSKKRPFSKLEEGEKQSEPKKLSVTTEPAKSIFENFKQGDILFGLLKHRNEVLAVLEKKGFHHTYANALNGTVVEMVVKGAATKEEIAKLDAQQCEHYHFLNRHRDYLLHVPGKPIPGMEAKPTEGAAYRRACKLLLIHREKNRTSRAHVITTGINWKRVCDKTESKKGVTDSEMRRAYRDFLAYGKNPHLLFYNNENQLMNTLPWEQPEHLQEWRHYDEQRQKKREANKPK